MYSFRPMTFDVPSNAAFDLLAVGQMIDDTMQPGHFFVAPGLRLSWLAGRGETIPWEIFRGRLLDTVQTRERKTFLSWQVIETNATEPLISVKLDVHGKQIHVTRGLLAHVWEGYDAGAGVIDSREAVRWTRELVGTIPLGQFANLASLRDELICVIWQAVVGTSRLPLTSIEAPLPAFSFGQLYYSYQPALGEADVPIAFWETLLHVGLHPWVAWRERVKLVEVVLRHVTPADLSRFTGLTQGLPLVRLLRAIFNSVSLSPYTPFVENALAWIDLLAQRGALTTDEKIDFFSHLLRQLCRHLTAYDMVTFHHRGANYPDALLLDAVLKAYLREIETHPDRFLQGDARLRRRAVRQACLLRQQYEGHLVPDLPTSPGENARVLPASYPRVPEEQLLQPLRRRRQLFTDDPLAGLLTIPGRSVIAQSVADLVHVDERTEMGMGLFIDRPLGYARPVGEPDLTPLLAHEALSPSIARRRWSETLRLCAGLGVPVDRAAIGSAFDHGPWPAGLPHLEVADCTRPTAALGDIRKVAADFVLLRTLPGGLEELMALFDWRTLLEKYSLRFLADRSVRLALQARTEGEPPRFAVYDAQMRRRLEMDVDVSQGYAARAGVEFPRAGLRVATIWEDTDDAAVLVRREIAGVVAVLMCAIPTDITQDG